MISFFRQPWRWASVYGVILLVAFGFALLDAFVIPKQLAALPSLPVSSISGEEMLAHIEPDTLEEPTTSASVLQETEETIPIQPVVTENSYKDENIEITIEEFNEYNTVFYVADIKISDPSYLKTALAQNTYGRNIKETTSEMAKNHNALFAINGDYYGFRDTGYVVRNATTYRNYGSGEALVIDTSGDFSIVEQGSITDEILADSWQIFSFGPSLVIDGAVTVDQNSEVSQSKTSNPRTAIGQLSDLHYIVIVSDGRTDQSQGLSLVQLAEEFGKRGVVTAYNLDGGGSSTMVFNGGLVNTPTSGRS